MPCSLRGCIEPILSRVLDLEYRRSALAAFRRAPAGGVDSVNLLDVPCDVGRDGVWRCFDHRELQPRHRWGAIRSGLGARRSGGVGDALGEVDAVVGSVGVEVECRGGGVGEVVSS